jgi:ubiquinol-cytochrome c reductase cytochrome b subunit
MPPIVGGARWAYVFGGVLVVLLAVQAVTGGALAAAYSPDELSAWFSVHAISLVAAGGWLVRGLHAFASGALIVTMGLHLLQVAVFGAYKTPRHLNWWLGLGLLVVTLAFAVTGGVLPWDQKGYWAARVTTGSPSLPAFYALHVVVLPLLVVALVAMHVVLFRRHGVTPGAAADPKKSDPFVPKQLARDLAAGVGLVFVLVLLAYASHGVPLDAPADPASDYPARPAWYFLPLFALAGSLHGAAKGAVVGLAAVGFAIYLVVLPRLDTVATTALGARMKLLAPLFLAGAALLLLTWGAVRSDKSDPKLQAALVAAASRAQIARELAMAERRGAKGPLDMLRSDPALHGEELFAKHCASCHVLGELGDAAEATAPALDGWGTEAWILGTLRDPDAARRFGSTAFAGAMPSVEKRPKDAPETWTAMPKEEMLAVASFLAAQGDEPGEEVPPLSPRRDSMLREAGEAIFMKECTACHTFEGEGDRAKTGSAPEMARYGSLAWTRALVASPSSSAAYRADALGHSATPAPAGRGRMPRFDTALSPDDVALVARWTRAKARGMPLRPGAP